MLRRHVLFAAFAVLAAAGMARAGLWQMRRLAERRAFNAVLRTRLDSVAVTPDRLPADTARLRYRRVRVDGIYDAAHEVVLVGRTRNGSPGVNLVTPLRRPGTDTAILVNRGWVYSGNAKDVESPTRWRATSATNDSGFADVFPMGQPGPIDVPGAPAAIRRLELGALGQRFPYPLAPYYIVLFGDTTAKLDSTPARLGAPRLTEGSHQSYVVQWFSFAGIALLGTVLYIRNDRRRMRAHTTIGAVDDGP